MPFQLFPTQLQSNATLSVHLPLLLFATLTDAIQDETLRVDDALKLGDKHCYPRQLEAHYYCQRQSRRSKDVIF